MKISISFILCVVVAVISEVKCAGLFQAVQSIKPCLDKATQKKISLIAALTAPEDWYEKCFVACLAKKMGNVSYSCSDSLFWHDIQHNFPELVVGRSSMLFILR